MGHHSLPISCLVKEESRFTSIDETTWSSLVIIVSIVGSVS